MRKTLLGGSLALALMGAAQAMCGYCGPPERQVIQPGQAACIGWDDQTHTETVTVQPQFSGNAGDFGMVIPTPSRPKLQEMPREFFAALAAFTVLEPMDPRKYPPRPMLNEAQSMDTAGGSVRAAPGAPPPIRVLEGGVVGNLDYKILEADNVDALFEWLKLNHYTYGGDRTTLDYYIQKRWTFTVMKIDPRQIKAGADGTYTGVISPTRFTFSTPKPVYPLRITQMSVPTETDALFYVMSRRKLDLGGKWTYETNFLNMWTAALRMAVPQYVTPAEKKWMSLLAKRPTQYVGWGTRLQWAGKLTPERLKLVTGERPHPESKKLGLLRGHLKQGLWLTKFRTTFQRADMGQDLELVPARIWGADDDVEYVSMLPTTPFDDDNVRGGAPVRALPNPGRPNN